MKLTMKKFSTKEIATLSERVVQASNSGKYKPVEDHPLLNNLEKETNIYKEVYSKITYSGKGTDVLKADKERDSLYTSLKAYLKAYAKMELLPHYQDAKALYDIWLSFGADISTLSYAEETAQMVRLIEEMDKQENTERLTHLNLLTTFQSLKTKQNNFESLYREQIEANAELRTIKSATSIRKDLEQALRAYIDFITAMKSVEGYKEIYAELNEIIKGIK